MFKVYFKSLTHSLNKMIAKDIFLKTKIGPYAYSGYILGLALEKWAFWPKLAKLSRNLTWHMILRTCSGQLFSSYSKK